MYAHKEMRWKWVQIRSPADAGHLLGIARMFSYKISVVVLHCRQKTWNASFYSCLCTAQAFAPSEEWKCLTFKHIVEILNKVFPADC